MVKQDTYLVGVLREGLEILEDPTKEFKWNWVRVEQLNIDADAMF